MRKIKIASLLALLVILFAACAAPPPAGDTAAEPAAAPAEQGEMSQLPVDVPREEVFVADQIFRYSVIDNYNFWVNGPHTPHRHALDE